MSVVDETQTAVEAAYRAKLLGPSDAGAVAVLVHMAEQIDAQVNGLTPDGKLDNVSVPTYLKFCDALGLTPTSRKRLTADAPAEKGASGGKLGQLKSIAGGKSA